MKYCEHCGSASEDNIRFCSNCGAKFPEQESEPVAAPVVDSPEVDPIYQPTFESNYQQNGQSYDQSVYRPVMMENDPPTMSGLAMTGFIISLISIFCCGMTSIIGLLFSVAGIISASRKKKKGLGFAIAGLIISLIFTLFIALELVVAWPAIENASKRSGDVQEFLDVLDEEIDRMQAEGPSYGRTTLYDWNDYELSDDEESLTIEYTDGIPDDYEFYDATFDEICDELEDNMVVTDNFGVEHSFDRETYRRLVSMYFISPDEYDNMDLTRSKTVTALSYLAVLSFEMSNDNFCPDSAVYIFDTNSYEYYGIIDPHNIGHANLVFTDGYRDVVFSDAMCGDEICWEYNFGDPEVYRLGLDSDSLSEYPAVGFLDAAEWAASYIEPLVSP